MGEFLDRLMFWKQKEPDFPDFGNEGAGKNPFGSELEPKTETLGAFADVDLGAGLTPPYPSKPSSPQFSQPQQPVQQTFSTPNRDLELINAKLDAIRANMENINQRLANLEQIARESI